MQKVPAVDCIACSSTDLVDHRSRTTDPAFAYSVQRLDQNNEQKSNTTAYNYLQANGVEVHWANPAYAVTHQKTITVDHGTSAIMTLNLVTEDYPTPRDFAVITNDPKDITAIETTFNADLGECGKHAAHWRQPGLEPHERSQFIAELDKRRDAIAPDRARRDGRLPD